MPGILDVVPAHQVLRGYAVDLGDVSQGLAARERMRRPTAGRFRRCLRRRRTARRLRRRRLRHLRFRSAHLEMLTRANLVARDAVPAAQVAHAAAVLLRNRRERLAAMHLMRARRRLRSRSLRRHANAFGLVELEALANADGSLAIEAVPTAKLARRNAVLVRYLAQGIPAPHAISDPLLDRLRSIEIAFSDAGLEGGADRYDELLADPQVRSPADAVRAGEMSRRYAVFARNRGELLAVLDRVDHEPDPLILRHLAIGDEELVLPALREPELIIGNPRRCRAQLDLRIELLEIIALHARAGGDDFEVGLRGYLHDLVLIGLIIIYVPEAEHLRHLGHDRRRDVFRHVITRLRPKMIALRIGMHPETLGA